MTQGLPLLFDEDEMSRLHEVARLAALQAGAKSGESGGELDQLTAEIFSAMAVQANHAVLHDHARPTLRLVEH
jgi:hypothetical protein